MPNISHLMVKTLFIMLIDTIKVQEMLQCIKMYIFEFDVNDRVSSCKYDSRPKLETVPKFLTVTTRKKHCTQAVDLSKT